MFETAWPNALKILRPRSSRRVSEGRLRISDDEFQRPFFTQEPVILIFIISGFACPSRCLLGAWVDGLDEEDKARLLCLSIEISTWLVIVDGDAAAMDRLNSIVDRSM